MKRQFAKATWPFPTFSPLPLGEGQGVRGINSRHSHFLLAHAQRVRVLLISLILAAFILPTGCRDRSSAGNPTATPARLQVFAGIPPLGWLVERIGGQCVEVGVLVQPGQNPHVFEPSPRQVVAMEKASMFFKIGMPFESDLVEKIAARHPRLTLVDASCGIVKRRMSEECDETATNTRKPGGPDPHVWLTPGNLKIMAATIATVLQKACPAHADEFHRNQMALTGELDALDARIRHALAPCRGQTFYVFHSALGYFADAYGLKQKSVETEGKSPTPRQLRRGEAGSGRGRAGYFPATTIRSPRRGDHCRLDRRRRGAHRSAGPRRGAKPRPDRRKDRTLLAHLRCCHAGSARD